MTPGVGSGRLGLQDNRNLLAGAQGLDAGLADRDGGVPVPGPRTVDRSRAGGVDPALQLDLVRLAEPLDEARE